MNNRIRQTELFLVLTDRFRREGILKPREQAFETIRDMVSDLESMLDDGGNMFEAESLLSDVGLEQDFMFDLIDLCSVKAE